MHYFPITFDSIKERYDTVLFWANKWGFFKFSYLKKKVYLANKSLSIRDRNITNNMTGYIQRYSYTGIENEIDIKDIWVNWIGIVR